MFLKFIRPFGLPSKNHFLVNCSVTQFITSQCSASVVVCVCVSDVSLTEKSFRGSLAKKESGKEKEEAGGINK